MKNIKEHWDNVYTKAETNKLGWYEENPSPSLKLIEKCKLNNNAHIFDVGSGVTTLISKLLNIGYKNISAIDVSEIAIAKAKAILQNEADQKINWIVGDITQSNNFDEAKPVDLWHDRTVLHFLTEDNLQQKYLETLKKLVKPSGYVIIAVFSLDGANKCSGLEIKKYDEKMISEFLGNEFTLLDFFPFEYIMPSSDKRPYIYTLFKRK